MKSRRKTLGFGDRNLSSLREVIPGRIVPYPGLDQVQLGSLGAPFDFVYTKAVGGDYTVKTSEDGKTKTETKVLKLGNLSYREVNQRNYINSVWSEPFRVTDSLVSESGQTTLGENSSRFEGGYFNFLDTNYLYTDEIRTPTGSTEPLKIKPEILEFRNQNNLKLSNSTTELNIKDTDFRINNDVSDEDGLKIYSPVIVSNELTLLGFNPWNDRAKLVLGDSVTLNKEGLTFCPGNGTMDSSNSVESESRKISILGGHYYQRGMTWKDSLTSPLCFNYYTEWQGSMNMSGYLKGPTLCLPDQEEGGDSPVGFLGTGEVPFTTVYTEKISCGPLSYMSEGSVRVDVLSKAMYAYLYSKGSIESRLTSLESRLTALEG